VGHHPPDASSLSDEAAAEYFVVLRAPDEGRVTSAPLEGTFTEGGGDLFVLQRAPCGFSPDQR